MKSQHPPLTRIQYAEEKFSDAVRLLATQPGDVRSRLYAACCAFGTVQLEDLPANLRRDFRWIIRMVTRREPRWISKGVIIDGSLKASLQQMQNRTGSKIAVRVWKIAEVLRNLTLVK